MKQLKSAVRNTIAPHHEALWQAAGATHDEIEINPGHYEIVPFFDTTVQSVSDPQADFLRNGRRDPIGTRFRHTVTTTTGAPREANVYIPAPDIDQQHPFMVHMDTAWFTGVEGHNDDVAKRFMKEIGAPVVLVGPEYSGKKDSIMQLGATALGSLKVSQARLAQESMAIGAALADQYGLATNVVKVGESRGAMLAQAQWPYAKMHGLDIVYMDITDPCLAKRILGSPQEVLSLARWPVNEGLSLANIGSKLVKDGSALRKLGTVSLNPHNLTGALLGTGRALFSGEAGGFPALVPHTVGVHMVSLKHNTMADHELWRQLYSNHPAFNQVVLRDAHLGLVDPSIPRHIIERIKKFGAEFLRVDQQLSRMQYGNVHMKDKGEFSLVA